MSVIDHSELFSTTNADGRCRLYESTKRFLDVVIALCVLVTFAPLWILIALVIRLSSPGPALYRQQRVVGKDGREFTAYKFRTMYQGSNDHLHKEAIAQFVEGQSLGMKKKSGSERSVYKLVNDPRVTPFGKLLRKSGLDEIPQFFNVLRSEMSVVGPRPPLYYEYEHYKDYQRQRLSVLPGITGLYQVTARSAVSFDRMVEIDLDYIARRSFWLDVRIILKTPWVMLTGRGAY